MCAVKKIPTIETKAEDLYRLLEAAAEGAAKTFAEAIDIATRPFSDISDSIVDHFVKVEPQVFDFKGAEIKASPDRKIRGSITFLDPDPTTRRGRKPGRKTRRAKRIARRREIRKRAEIQPLPMARLLDDLTIMTPADWKRVRREHRIIRRELAELSLDDVRFPFVDSTYPKGEYRAPKSVRSDTRADLDELLSKRVTLASSPSIRISRPDTTRDDIKVIPYTPAEDPRRSNPADLVASVRVGRYGEPVIEYRPGNVNDVARRAKRAAIAVVKSDIKCNLKDDGLCALLDEYNSSL